MRIYYLRGPSGGLDQFIKYQSTIEKFINRGSRAHGLNFEKLRVSEKAAIYSIRVNDVCRILLMKYKDGYCLVEVVEDHKYEQSQIFKNPLIFSRLLSAESGEAVELPSFEAFIAADAGAFSSAGGKRQLGWERVEDCVEDGDPVASGSRDLRSSSPLEYHGQFITLNPEQEAVAIHPSLPVIVSGPAGSGKSSVALSMLSQHLREHREEPDAFPVLYVCESQDLMRETRRLWQEMVGADALSSRVEFKTYGEMLAEQLRVDAAMLLGKEAFLAWCKDGKRTKGFSASDETVWQECRIRSGYTSDADYLSLGDRQSSFKREEQTERAVVCSSYKAFLQYAQSRGQRVPALEDLSGHIRKPYKLIAADEAQDLSFAQLHFLYRLSGGSIALFLGDNQILQDNLSRLPFLKAMFRDHHRDPENVVSLGLTYRCSEAVTILANALTRIKYELTGGAADSLARMLKVADASSGKGTASLFQLKDSAQIERFAHLASSSRDVFVITQPEYVEEAQAIFRTGQVFTPERVKGLEAHVVILWRLLDCAMAREAARCVSPDGLADKSHAGHRAKAGVGDSRYEPFGNSLIVAATRAMHHVVMFEKQEHAIGPILRRLAKALETTQGPSESLLGVVASSSGDWAEQVFKLYLNGFVEQARVIFVRSLHGRPEDFNRFIAAHGKMHEGHASAVAVESMKTSAATSGGCGAAAVVDVAVRKATDADAASAVAGVFAGPSSDEHVRRLRDVLSHSDSKGKDVLLADKGNLTLLRQMSDELFASIPLDGWLVWLGKKKTLRPLLLDLVADVEHGPFVLRRLLASGLAIPPKIWAFTAEGDHGAFPGTSIAYWLLMTPEGQEIFTQLRQTIDISKIITTHFLITAPPGRQGLSPLAMLIAFEPGLKLLRLFAKNLKKVFQNIPIVVWSSPHPSIRSEKGGHLSLINSFQSNPNGLTILKSLLPFFCDPKALMDRAVGDPWLAVINGDSEPLRTAHGLGLDLNTRIDEHGNTLAMLAVEHGHAGIIRELHRLKINLDAMTGVSIAGHAIKYGRFDILRTLHECGVDLSEEREDVEPAAIIAVNLGSVRALTVLHQCGVKFNQMTRYGAPALRAIIPGNLEVIKELCRFSDDINIDELLFAVAYTNHFHIAEFLISNVEYIRGVMPMSEEKLRENFQDIPDVASKIDALIKELVAKGQDVSCLKLSPIDVVRLYGYPEMVALFEEKIKQQERAFVAGGGGALDEILGVGSVTASVDPSRVARQLTQFGRLKAAPGLEGRGWSDELMSPWAAAELGDIATLTRLHTEGLALNNPEARGYTPAILAAMTGQVSVLRLLHSYGIDINQESPSGASSAMMAISKGKVEVLRVLYELCPPINTLSLGFLATVKGSVEILEFLSTKGANYSIPIMISPSELIEFCDGKPAAIRRMGELIRVQLATGQDKLGVRVLPIDVASALGHEERVIDFLRTSMEGPVSVHCDSDIGPVEGAVTAALPVQSARPQVATALSQLGILATGTGSASRSTESQSSSDDPRSLAASAGSFPDLKS